jgi:hypothetical protein
MCTGLPRHLHAVPCSCGPCWLPRQGVWRQREVHQRDRNMRLLCGVSGSMMMVAD